MSGKFVLKKSENDRYHFNLKAGNGEIILASELYESKDGAMNGIASVKTNAVLDERYERKTSASNQPYFVLVAGNSQVIGKSEMYSSIDARENGIASVKKNAPEAEVEDLTVAA
jgi:uncharacterized protein